MLHHSISFSFTITPKTLLGHARSFVVPINRLRCCIIEIFSFDDLKPTEWTKGCHTILFVSLGNGMKEAKFQILCLHFLMQNKARGFVSLKF